MFIIGTNTDAQDMHAWNQWNVASKGWETANNNTVLTFVKHTPPNDRVKLQVGSKKMHASHKEKEKKNFRLPFQIEKIRRAVLWHYEFTTFLLKNSLIPVAGRCQTTVRLDD